MENKNEELTEKLSLKEKLELLTYISLQAVHFSLNKERLNNIITNYKKYKEDIHNSRKKYLNMKKMLNEGIDGKYKYDMLPENQKYQREVPATLYNISEELSSEF